MLTSIALFSYTRAFGDGHRNFEPWSSDDINTSTLYVLTDNETVIFDKAGCASKLTSKINVSYIYDLEVIEICKAVKVALLLRFPRDL
ncbi:hypothetical protein TNCV_54131 [Trichonephila clavipes]|nr:hypothetical protein TNCV_54131 [Trichonephila clavipes]